MNQREVIRDMYQYVIPHLGRLLGHKILSACKMMSTAWPASIPAHALQDSAGGQVSASRTRRSISPARCSNGSIECSLARSVTKRAKQAECRRGIETKLWCQQSLHPLRSEVVHRHTIASSKMARQDLLDMGEKRRSDRQALGRRAVRWRSLIARPIYGKPMSELSTCPIAQVSRASTTSRR